MGNKIKVIAPVAAAAALVAVVLVLVLVHSHKPAPKPQAVAAKNCSLLSSANAVKYLGKGTYLQQAKTSNVENVMVVGCQYTNPHPASSLVIGQKEALTNYGEEALKKSFFSNVASGEVQIVFASYSGYSYKNQPGDIRIWFKNTWLQVFSPSQKISEEVLTNFVKTH